MEITKVYKQKIPAARFIGIKYSDSDRVDGFFGAKWSECFENNIFDKIEKAAGGAEVLHAFFEDADAYIGLMRACDGEPFQYWIGEFTPVGTPVPDGMSYIDMPAANIGVGWVFGVESDIYCHEPDVIRKIEENGMKMKKGSDGATWFFERYQCPRFTTPDSEGRVILDICFFVE